MHVVATAGHVDHGKSTLVRALTGTDPDRLAEEKRRGLTIELGYAHTDLDSGARVAFVDVPGHQRFLATMLAGVGAVPAALLVVAADEGWAAQTAEHVAALDALGVRHALLVVTKTDRADPEPVAADVMRRLAGTGLATVPWVGVSALTGAGLGGLRVTLDALVGRLPEPPQSLRSRLFVDRVFTVRGAGTVVTGTLAAGTIRVGDALEVGGRIATVRGLECCHEPVTEAHGVARVAVNLRGRPRVGRGDALLTPGAWPQTTAIDVALTAPAPRQVILHVASAAVPVTVRRLGDTHARLILARPLPLVAGDRGVLRDPGRHTVAAGVVVLDPAPPALAGRGAAPRRAAELSAGRPLAAEPTTPSRDTPPPTPIDPLDLSALEGLGKCWAAGSFAAPDGSDLQRLGLDRRILARLAAAGHLLRLPGDVVLPPGADDRALAVLAELPQPFSIAAAKDALGVSRRVAVPLLEHLDRQRRTRREGDARWVR